MEASDSIAYFQADLTNEDEVNHMIEAVISRFGRVDVLINNAGLAAGRDLFDEALMDASNLVEGERVQVVNINNGERLETYVIKGDRGSGTICLNGPAARKVAVGDMIIVIGYGYMTPEEARSFKPSLVFPNELTNLIV